MSNRTFSHRATCAVVAVALLSSAACAGRTASSAPKPLSTDAVVAAAAQSFENAVAHADTTALNSLLADNLVVWRGADSLAGAGARRAVVAAWGAGHSSAELLLTRGERTTCPDAAFETGRFTAYERTSADSSQATASGTYGVRWTLVSGGAPRVAVVTLDTAAMSRTSQRVFCATASRLHAEHQRVVLLGTLPLTQGSWSTHDELNNQLVARGWPSNNMGFCTHFQQTNTGYPAGYDCSRAAGVSGPPLEMVGARVRIMGPVWVEGIGDLIQQTGTSMGYQSSTGSFIVQSYKSRELMALASYEWKHLRVGVGAARVNVNWNEFSDVLQNGGRVGPALYVNSSASGTGLGSEVAYSVKVLPPVSFELVARHCSGIEVAVPAIGPYPESTASFNGTTISAGLSVGY